MVRNVALIPHLGKDQAIALAARLLPALEAKGTRVWLDSEAAERLGRPDLIGEEDAFRACSVGLVLGGDGALLKAARTLAPHGIPVMGVNLGHLGFLTEVDPPEVDRAIDRLFAGEYEIEERMMLEAQVVKKDGLVSDSFLGLNDAVLTRGVFVRVIELSAYVADHLVGTFLADGVIVATPTGSTAYSLSAGGPIVNPSVEALIVTPICPHTVGARTLITRADECVRIRLDRAAGEAILTVDGQLGARIEPGDEVRVRRARCAVRLVKMMDRTFYSLLHTRFLSQGGRGRSER